METGPEHFMATVQIRSGQFPFTLPGEKLEIARVNRPLMRRGAAFTVDSGET